LDDLIVPIFYLFTILAVGRVRARRGERRDKWEPYGWAGAFLEGKR